MESEESLDCIFCKIVSGELGTELVASNEHAVAFADINPLAKVHYLVVPRKHSPNISHIADANELSGIFELVREVVSSKTDGQFRLQFNTGEKEGQTVFHTHAHVLSGRSV